MNYILYGIIIKNNIFGKSSSTIFMKYLFRVRNITVRDIWLIIRLSKKTVMIIF
jgi:hypothetical protein